MNKIDCYYDECIHCHSGKCGCSIVTIDQNGNCDAFESFLDTAEWQSEFYKCCRCYDKNGRKHLGKQLEKGKRIEYKGYIFYTQDREHHYLTEERTGYMMTKEELEKEETFLLFDKMIRGIKDVKKYPLCEYDEATHKSYIKE